jgi:hypothetical protein
MQYFNPRKSRVKIIKVNYGCIFITLALGVKNEIKCDDGKWVLNGTAEKILQSLNSMNPVACIIKIF